MRSQLHAVPICAFAATNDGVTVGENKYSTFFQPAILSKEEQSLQKTIENQVFTVLPECEEADGCVLFCLTKKYFNLIQLKNMHHADLVPRTVAMIA